MTSIITVLDEAETQLAPLDRNWALAEWDAAVGGDDGVEERMIEASMALEDALSDPDRYAKLAAAEEPDDPIGARRLAILRDETRAHQRPRELAERIVRLEASLTTLYSEHRGTIDGRPVSNNEIDTILRDSRDRGSRRAAWDASKEIGPRAAPAGARAGAGAQRGGARPRVPRLLRDVAGAAGARRGLAVRTARSSRAAARRRMGAREGRDRRGAASADRHSRGRAAAAVGLRRAVLPGPAAGRRRRARDGAGGTRSAHGLARLLRRARRSDRGHPLAQRPLPSPAQEPARVLHPGRPRR